MEHDIARAFGAWLGGFAITFAAGYVVLRFARSPRRRPMTAWALRVLAVAVAVFFAYGGYVGGGGRINLGHVFAVLVVATLAVRGQAGRRKA